jgi:tRNA(Leu) C34 or U34 (ribose-2'-O)-methylase TrmL
VLASGLCAVEMPLPLEQIPVAATMLSAMAGLALGCCWTRRGGDEAEPSPEAMVESDGGEGGRGGGAQEEPGFCAIGIYAAQNGRNTSMLLRSAYLLGADAVFTVGRRYRKGRGGGAGGVGDTLGAASQLKLAHYATLEEMLADMPAGVVMVGVEKGGASMQRWRHPPRAVYLLGSEDEGLPASVATRCGALIELETARRLASATPRAAVPANAQGTSQGGTNRAAGRPCAEEKVLDPGMFNVTAAGTLTLFHRAVQRGELTCGTVPAPR